MTLDLPMGFRRERDCDAGEDVAPEDIEPRACQCSFCRQHQSRSVSDPTGRLRITVANGDLLSRYQFAMKSIEFLICRECGV